MKRYYPTLALVIIAAAFALYNYKFERGEVIEGKVVLQFEPDQVQKLELHREKGAKESAAGGTEDESSAQTVVLERKGDAWRMVKPVDTRVDKDKVDTFVDSVKNLATEDAFEYSSDSLSTYGLKSPRAALTVHIKGRKKPLKLQFGATTPDSVSVYAFPQGADHIFVVRKSIFDDVVKDANDYRDKKAVVVDSDKVNKIQITRGDTVVLAQRSGDQWQLKKPVTARADKYEVDNLVTKVKDLTIEKWVDDAPKDIAQYGLKSPQMKVELWMGKTRRSLYLGAKADDDDTKVYAKNGNEKPVFLVKKEIIDDLSKEPKELRDKKVLSIAKADVVRVAIKGEDVDFEVRKTAAGDEERWQMTRPQNLKADSKAVDNLLWDLTDLRADDFIDDPGALSEYGLDKPVMTAKVWKRGIKSPTVIKVGAKADDGSGVYVTTEDGKEVYKTSTTVLTDWKLKPEKLRDRTVMKLKREDLTKVVLKHGKTEIEIHKDGMDWRMVKPEKKKADPGEMSSLLWKFEDYHADQFVTDKPKADKEYGFDKPQARASFYLKGKKKPIDLVVGKSTPDNKVYVRVRSSKSVFLDDDSVLSDLQKTAADFEPAPPPPTPGGPMGY